VIQAARARFVGLVRVRHLGPRIHSDLEF